MREAWQNGRRRARPIGMAALVLVLGACTTMVPRGPASVTLIAINDFHGQLQPIGTDGGVASLAGMIGELKARHPLNAVVGAGDLIGASPLDSGLFHDEPSIEALSLAGLEFSSVGNHEFDDGVPELKRVQAGGCAADAPERSCREHPFAGAQYKYLAANVLETATGKPLFPPYAFKTFAIGGAKPLKVAFIGAVVKSTPNIVIADAVKSLTFTDEAAAVNAVVPEVKAQGADVIVLLIHEGGFISAKAFDDTTCPDFTGDLLPILDRLDPAVSVVVSGHTHKTYICRRNGRLITSAGLQGRYITDIELKVDPRTRKVVESSATQLAVTSDKGPKNAAVQAIADSYAKAAAPLTQRSVAAIREDITREKSPAGESPLGDLIADAQLAATSDAAKGGAQIALMNVTGIRADLSAATGHVLFGTVFAVHPFGNALVTLTLTGAQIHDLLESQWTTATTILQVSQGFTYEWQEKGAPGAKIDPASIKLNGTPIEPRQTYRVTVNEFLASGNDGFKPLAGGTDRVRGVLDAEALERYLTAHSPISAPKLERIRMK